VDIIAAVTGATADAGEATAIQAVFNEVNSTGGVNGHKITFKVLDDQSSTTVAPANARKAVADNPVAILDVTGSATLAAKMPIFTSAKIPVLSNFALQLGFFPWLYSDGPTPAQQS